MNERHISHSQISCLLNCARQYYYRYIERIKVPTGAALLLGGSYHAGIELNFRSKVVTGKDEPIEKCLAAFEQEWKYRLGREEIDWQDKSPGDVKDTGCRLLRLYMETTAPFVMPREAERRFSIQIPEVAGWTLDGVIDLVTDKGVIVDHKTSGRAKNQADLDKDLQPYAYTAELLTDPMLDEAAFEWHTAIDKKQPEIQRLETRRTRADVEWYLTLVRECIRQIKAGIFPASPNGWWCDPRYCGYWQMCKGGAR